jgi:hypothetical protein
VSTERCSDLSREAGEPLHATATTAVSWLLLEVPGSWPRDVSAPEALPPVARQAVDEWLLRTPASRLLFLRRPARADGGPPAAFLVRAEEGKGVVRRLELSSHEELASFDLERDGRPDEGPLVLVCGHGSRDSCCALRGTAVFTALAGAVDEDALWISSHHGGHRFAANVLVLPAGLHFGRVEPEDAHRIVTRALAGRIELGNYRGRTCYEPAVQAAEHAVRVAAGLEGVGDLRLLGADDDTVRFASAARTYTASVEALAGPVLPASCGAAPGPQPVLAARLG